MVKGLPVEDEAVTGVKRLPILLFLRLVHALDQELQQAVQAAGL